MDNQILFELGLDSHKAVNAWENFVQEIQKGNNTIFSFISKVSEAFNNQEKTITQLVNSNNKLTDSQNKLTNSTNNLNVASNNQKNILKSQVIEQESLNQSYTKEQQSIQNIINAQQLLQKERKQSIDLLRAENKENNLKIADIRIDNKALSFDTSKNEIQKTIDRNLNNQAIIEYERRNAVRNLEIKAISDEINKTNELLLVQKELLTIDKVKSSENKNSINDTNLKIKAIQLENESLKEQEKIKRDVENKQTKLTKEVTKEASSDLKDETSRLLQNQKRAIEEKKQAEIEELKVIQAKIIAVSTLAKDIKEEISLTNSKKFALKNITDEQKAFNNNIDKNVSALKEQKRELTDNIRLLSNKRDNLKNSNVEILANTNAIAKNISELEKQKALISSMPKPEKDNNALSSWENLVNRIQNNVVGTLISTMVRTVLNEIRPLFQETTKEFIQLERNVAAIKGLLLDNPISTDVLQSKINQIADKTGSSIAGASENIRTIITGGIDDIDEAVKIYDQSLILARTSVSKNISEQEALNQVMNSSIIVMSNYKLKADDLPTVFNQISIGATKSKTDVSDFSKYLGNLSSVFSAIGTPLNEVITLFSLVTNKMRNASEANTVLTNIMRKIQNPTATQKKELDDLNKQTGGNLEFSVSYVNKVGGINGFLKEFYKDVGKLALPDDAIAKMFNLASASKGIKNLGAIWKNVNKEGLNEFDILNNKVLNNVDDLKDKNELIIKIFGQQIETLKNSFIALFMKPLASNEEFLHNLFDNLVLNLNIVLGLLKPIGDTLTLGLFSEDNKSKGEFLQNVFRVIAFELEVIIKTINLAVTSVTGFFEVLGLHIGATIKRLFYIAGSIGNLLNYFTNKEEFEKNKIIIKEQLNQVSDILNKRTDEIVKNQKNKLVGLFDFGNYSTVNPKEQVTNKLENRAKTAENKMFLPPVNLIGEGVIDFNTKLSDQAQEATLKASLDKFAYKRDQLKKALEEDKKKSYNAYDTVNITAPQQIDNLSKELLNPKTQEYEKAQILEKIDKLNNLQLNNEKNYKNAQLALAKRYKAELLAIDKEELKDRETKIKQVQLLRKKEIDDKYSQQINKKQVEINDIQDNNPKVNKIEVLKLQNQKLLELETIYNNKAKELNFKEGLVDKSEAIKQASDTRLKILKNDKEVLKEQLSIKLQTDKLDNDKTIKAVERFASKNDLNKDTELNNLQLVDKQRIKQINERLKNESSLTLEQSKILEAEKENLEQKHIDREDEKQKIRKQRIIDNVFFEIDQEKIKFNLLVEMGQKSNKAQLENDITTNNKMIAEYQKQIDLLDKVKSSDKIDELNKKITPLENANEIDKYKINELSYKLQKEQDDKLFSDKNKSLELFRNLQIYSEETLSKELIKINDEKLKALENQEKIFIATYGTNPENEAKKVELDQLKESILDTNNFILVESKKLTEAIYQEEKRKLDIQIGFLDNYSNAFSKFGESLKNTNNDVFSLISSSFNSLSENYNKAIGIFKQIEPIQKQISDNKARQNSIKPLLNDEIEKYKQTGIPTTKLSNLVNENKKLESDNKTANQQANLTGVMSAIEQVTNMISKGVEVFNKQDEATKKLSQTYQLFGKDSKEVALAQGEMIESNLEMIKILPGVGDILYKLIRMYTDFTGATKSEKEKKDMKDIESATLSYAKTKLNATANYHETKIEMVKLDTQAELKALNDMNLSQQAFDIKKAEILEKSNQRLLQLNKDYYNQLDDLRNQNRALELSSMPNDIENKKYLANLEFLKEIKAIKSEYNLTDEQLINSNDAVINQRFLNASQKRKDDFNKIDIDSSEKTIALQKAVEKATINLQEESLTKKQQLAFLEYQGEKDLAAKEKALGQSDFDYKLTLNQIELKWQKTQIDLSKEASDKIRSINEKNYNEELKAFESLNKNKTDKLKSDLQKQFDIISEYEQKKKDLLESREQDQALKVKRANQLEIDIAKKKADLKNNGAFYIQNELNFNTGDGVTSGNETIRKKVDDQYDLGLISYKERNDKRQQLALEKELYYESLLSKYHDPKDQERINSKITEAKKEYYDFIFDKEKEKLDIEKEQADKKIIAFQDELTKREKLEADYITKLDNAYKTSAGLYKETFVKATTDWIDEARKQTIQKLGIDTFNQLQKTAINLNDNKKEAEKYLSANPTTTSTPNNSNAFSLPNNQQTNSTQNNINANNNNGYNPSSSNPFDVKQPNNNNGYNPSNVFGPFDVDPTLSTAEKQKILANIYDRLGASYYTQAERLSNTDLISFADKYNIPKFKNGGATKGASIFGEGGSSEVAWNYGQMKNMNSYILEVTKNGGYGVKGSTIYNIHIEGAKITGNMNNLSEMKTLLKESNEELMIKIKDKKIGVQ